MSRTDERKTSGKGNVIGFQSIRYKVALFVSTLLLLGSNNLASAGLLDEAYVEATYSLGYGAEGSTWDGGYLWISDIASATFKRYDTSGSGFVLAGSIPRIAGGVGLTWDGNFLWSSSGSGYYKIDADSGNIVDSFSAAGTSSLGGLTYDGQYLWKASRPEFNKIDPVTGSVVQTISGIDLPGIEEGMAFDGEFLFAISYTSASDPTIWKIDPVSGLLGLDSFSLPSGLYNGLAFDGESFWAVDWSGQEVHKISFLRAVPEPSALLLIAFGLLGVALRMVQRVLKVM